LLGYPTEGLGSAARDEAAPPTFENWSSLFVIGLEALVVVVPVLGVSLGSTIAALAEPNSAGVLAGLGVVGLLANTLAFLILYYRLPATLTNPALGRTIGSAFDVASLRRTLLGPTYFRSVWHCLDT
jgi:uncharacterized BrkB/YihY/UPF0761 family membrane protein